MPRKVIRYQDTAIVGKSEAATYSGWLHVAVR